MKPRELVILIRDSAAAWSEDRASRQAAALAYYSMFAIAPMIALITIIIGRLLRNRLSMEDVLQEILLQIEVNLDPAAAQAVAGIVSGLLEPDSGLVSTLVSLGVLLFAASGLLAQLQLSMDVVWQVAPDPERGALGLIKDRALAVGFIGILGLLVMATFVVNTVINTAGSFLSDLLPESLRLYAYLDTAITLTALTVLFALVFKVLPRVKIGWRDVWIGALVTAILFTVGMKLVSFYLATSGLTSVFGASGSLVFILVWVYFCAQIFLFGAEFTKVYANRFGSQIRPGRGAVYRIPRSIALTAPAAALQEPATQSPKPGLGAETVSPTPRQSSEGESGGALPFGWLVATFVALLLGIILGGQRRS